MGDGQWMGEKTHVHVPLLTLYILWGWLIVSCLMRKMQDLTSRCFCFLFLPVFLEMCLVYVPGLDSA